MVLQRWYKIALRKVEKVGTDFKISIDMELSYIYWKLII